VTSLLAQVLLFRANADLGYRIFHVTNEKFISVFDKAFSKSDVPEHHIDRYGCRLEHCRATASLILRCLR